MGRKKDRVKGEGEYDRSTLYTCIKYNETCWNCFKKEGGKIGE
jgi:hypothetical protein